MSVQGVQLSTKRDKSSVLDLLRVSERSERSINLSFNLNLTLFFSGRVELIANGVLMIYHPEIDDHPCSYVIFHQL